MKNDDHLYLDVVQLSERGWTETMVKRFLGAPDRWKPVDHYANWTGKRTFFLERIQTTEASPEFEDAFSRSIRRRRIKEEKHAQFMEQRARGMNDVREWCESLTEEDKKTIEAFNRVAEIFQEARQRGYRTPHKA